MRRTKPLPEPVATQRPRRFEVMTSVVVPRPRETVWEEYAEEGHPAWSDHAAEDCTASRVGDLRGLAEGARTLVLGPGPHGLAQAFITTIRAVQPGSYVESDTLITGIMEMRETLTFVDHPSGGTFVSLRYVVGTIPITEARESRLNYNLQRLQRGYLQRAVEWQSGDPHKPNIVAPEAADLAF